MPVSVLFVEHSPDRVDLVRRELPDDIGSITTISEVPRALAEIDGAGGTTSVIVISLESIETYPTSIVRLARARWPWVSPIVIDGPASSQVAASTIKAGAEYYLSETQSSAENVAEAVGKTLKHRPRTLGENPTIHSNVRGKLIGRSNSMQKVFERISISSENEDLSVLLCGETGTGKTHTAHAIHVQSTQGTTPLMRIDCRCLPPNRARALFEGRNVPLDDEDGSRAAAVSDFKGGTILLEHVDQADRTIQDLLIYALETLSVSPNGTAPEEEGIRFIGTTSSFPSSTPLRPDLYHRLADLPIFLPPLRSRTEDILPLARHFLQKFSSSGDADDLAFTPDAQANLRNYFWPGNLRQLKTVVRRATRIASSLPIDSDALILPDWAPAKEPNRPAETTGQSAAPPSDEHSPRPARNDTAPPEKNDPVPSEETSPDVVSFGATDQTIPSLEEVKKKVVKRAYEMYDGDVDRAAVALDIGRATMYRMLKRHDLRDDS